MVTARSVCRGVFAALVGPCLAVACSLDQSGKTACRSSADCLGNDVCHENVCRDSRGLSGASAGGQSDAGGGSGAGGKSAAGGSAPSGGAGPAAGGVSLAGAGGQDRLDSGAGGDPIEPGTGGQGSASEGGPRGCGDGLIAESEECDDGNQREQDGCSPGCSVEAGFACTRVHGPSSRCFTCAGALRVDARSTATTPSGATWAEAFADLQAALGEAAIHIEAGCAGAELWVAEGRYVPSRTGNRSASFALGPRVAVYGGFAGNEGARTERRPLERRALLSGDLAGDDATAPGAVADNSLHVVRATGLDSTSVLDGFEIRGGNGDTLSSWGAGMVHEGGNGTYRNLVVAGNTSSGTAAGCMILGGAPVLESVYFVGNHSTQTGSALQSGGSPTLRGVTVLANTGGVAVALAGGGNPQLDSVIFAGNDGGALQVSSGALTAISNLVVAGNRSDFWAVLLGANIDVVHATVAFNHSTGPIGTALGIAPNAEGARVRNAILWGNAPVDVGEGDERFVVDSVVTGATGAGNVDADPRFQGAGPGGTWTAAPSFDPRRTQTRLVDASATFPDLASGFIQVRSSGTAADPRLALIAENDATGLWVWGDVTRWTALGDTYVVRRLTLAPDSPAVDTADPAHSTPTDTALRARHDVPGRGTAISDRGAYEWTP